MTIVTVVTGDWLTGLTGLRTNYIYIQLFTIVRQFKLCKAMTDDH